MELKRYILFQSNAGWICEGEPTYTSSYMPTCIHYARQNPYEFSFIIDRHCPQHVIYLDKKKNCLPHEDILDLNTDDFPLLKEILEKGLIQQL